jgi:major tropism determinant Mtd-like protein
VSYTPFDPAKTEQALALGLISAAANGGSATSGPANPVTVRRDTQANWFAQNPVLRSGELAYETDTSFLRVGDGATAYGSLPIVQDPNVWTPKTQGLIAATLDLATVPSQSAVTAGRIFYVPVRVDQSLSVGGVVAAYQTATAGNVNTNTFIGVYDAATGTLLGETADLASFLTTTTGAIVVQPLVTPITGLKTGQKLFIALLNNYSTTGPQWMGSRLYGTNFSTSPPTGTLPRLFVSPSTATSLPGTITSMAASGTNSIPAIGLTQ